MCGNWNDTTVGASRTTRADTAREVAGYVDRLLRGPRPDGLTVEQTFKTAKGLGLAIPQPLLLQAERVIE